jgi:hypothetical protein
LTARVGGGLYYEYDHLAEKGFFNMPELEALGKERVNSYDNDFSMHLVGPLVDAGLSYRASWISAGFSAGVVPVYRFFGGIRKQRLEVVGQ